MLHFYEFFLHHEAVGLMAFSAIVVGMPEALPATLRELPAWFYAWIHTTVKTFANVLPKKPGA